MVGCNYEIDSKGDRISDLIKFHYEPIIIKWRMCFENPVPSPVLFKSIYLTVGGFDERSKVGMDYDFFKVAKIDKISNIQEPIMFGECMLNQFHLVRGNFN